MLYGVISSFTSFHNSNSFYPIPIIPYLILLTSDWLAYQDIVAAWGRFSNYDRWCWWNRWIWWASRGGWSGSCANCSSPLHTLWPDHPNNLATSHHAISSPRLSTGTIFSSPTPTPHLTRCLMMSMNPLPLHNTNPRHLYWVLITTSGFGGFWRNGLEGRDTCFLMSCCWWWWIFAFVRGWVWVGVVRVGGRW